MKKPLVNNRFLNRKWRELETDDLNCKVKNMKHFIKIECPESYTYRKEHLPEQLFNPRKEEIKRRNRIMVEKIYDMYNNPKPCINSLTFLVVPPLVEYKIGNYNNSVMREKNRNINKENLNFSKRLEDRKSHLDRKKWESDYNLSKYLVGLVCEYPSVNFDKKSPNKDSNINTSTSFSKTQIPIKTQKSKFSHYRSHSNGFNNSSITNKPGTSGFKEKSNIKQNTNDLEYYNTIKVNKPIGKLSEGLNYFKIIIRLYKAS